MSTPTLTPAIGTPLDRVDGRLKVTGQARYTFEQPVERVAYAVAVQSQVARGEIRAVDAAAALALPGVLAVISHENAPRLATDDGELAILQSPAIAYRGQIVAGVVAASLETATEAARLVRIEVDAAEHDVELRPDHPRLYEPETINPGHPSRTELGDPDAALADADVVLDATYATPAFHNNPMEPHASLALWNGDALTLYDATQSTVNVREALAKAFALPVEQVRVISHHVGGGFGSKGNARPQAILAAIAARHVGRPVKIAVTRRQMFAFVGYRTPTIQRLRLGADRDGRLSAIVHDVVEQSSTLKEFAEQTGLATRMMYAAPHRRTTHQLARLDVPTPSWMRAPGECPGMFALESALDELAIACGLDPIELRVRNEPDVHPESGLPFSSRNLIACLHEGAARFGWAERDPAPGVRRDGRWLLGSGVAASTYPAYQLPSQARICAGADGTFLVRIAAADIGTGARTVLTQIAADALGVAPEAVHVELGDSAFPRAPVAGGSMGTASWGSAIVKAAAALRERLDAAGGVVPPEGIEADADTTEDVQGRAELARHAFGAQFAAVRVDPETGEVRVARLLGVFAAGRILNPKTARSQFIGGMTMGLSMALHEESVMDRAFGDYVNADLASYHVAACADVEEIDAVWIDETDDALNPMGSKGIGEIGIVGTAAAIANAVHHATGVRVRELPIRPDRLLAR